MYGYIYITTNKINGIIYIGQHKSKKFTTSYKGSGTLIRRAIEKYGKENFEVHLIEWCETQKDADEKEKYWEKLYGLPNIDIGYNITRGGQDKFFTGMKHTSESRKMMSNKAKKRPHPPTTLGRIVIHKNKDNKYIEKY